MTMKVRVNVSIASDVMQNARELGINASAAAEEGIRRRIKLAREEAWIRENADAIRAHNERIEREGPLLTPVWAETK
jgi:antitoxin CcdA